MDCSHTEMEGNLEKPDDDGRGQITVSPAANTIFSQVIATVAMELMEHVPGDKEMFLRSFMSDDMGLHHNTDTGALSVFGVLDDIIKCRDKLTEFVGESKAWIDVDEVETVSEIGKRMYVDVGITCDILTDVALENGTVKVEDTSVCSVEPNVETNETATVEDNKDTLHVEMAVTQKVNTGESEVGGSKGVALTRRGRVIKRPYKLEDSDVDTGKLDEDLEEAEVAEPEVKHRRLIRPRKRQGVTKAKDRDKISVEEVRRLVQEEKEKEAREKGETDESEAEKKIDLLNAGVLQNIFLNGLSELQVQEAQKDTVKLYSEMNSSDDMKKMKKYYEERMPFKYFCAVCSFKSKRESHFKAHMKLHERNPYMELHECNQCEFTTIRQGTLRRHLLTHTENLLKCSTCSYQTNSYNRLESHKKRHIRKETLDFMPKLKCNLCNFMTLSKVKLIAHMDLHRNSDGEPVFNCNLCKYKSKRKEHLVRHQDNVHSNKRPFLCDLCGTAFKRVDALAAHKTTHIERSLRKLPYLCPHCKKGFKSQAHLKEHMSVHTTVRSFQCHICGQMFKTRAVQRRHQQSIHFNPRSHKCTHCNKDFNTKYAFQRHLRIHDSDPAGHLPTQVQPQVKGAEKSEDAEATVDENISAIQTITIAPENLNEFTQQLQNVSDQLQSATDIGEIYIQGLDGVEAETINIINFEGQEVQQIYVPGGTTDLGSIPTSGDQVKQIFITSKSDGDPSNQNSDKKSASVVQPELIKQILISSDGSGLNVASLKEFLVQSDQGTEQVRHILIPSVESTTGTEFQDSESLGTDMEGVEDQGLIVQAEQGQGAEGRETVKTDIGGATYQIKLDDCQTLLTLGSTAVQNL